LCDRFGNWETEFPSCHFGRKIYARRFSQLTGFASPTAFDARRTYRSHGIQAFGPLLGYGQMPKHVAAILRLMEHEDELNSLRKLGESSYNLIRHIDVLIAIVGEARLLSASRSKDCETVT
jgi:hypothetical protein